MNLLNLRFNFFFQDNSTSKGKMIVQVKSIGKRLNKSDSSAL